MNWLNKNWMCACVLESVHQLTFIDKFQIFANVVKWSKIELVELRWILNGNYIFTSERLVRNKVLPEVWFDVQLFNSLKPMSENSLQHY